MKRKRIGLSCMVLAFVLLFAGCEKKSYRNDLSAADVAQKLVGSLVLDVDYGNQTLLSDQAEIPADADLTVCTAKSGVNIDEFGVWHTDHPAQARKILETYLDKSYEQNKTYYDSYIPEQTAKLRDAEVREFGSYVVYAILDPDRKKELFHTVGIILSDTKSR